MLELLAESLRNSQILAGSGRFHFEDIHFPKRLHNRRRQIEARAGSAELHPSSKQDFLHLLCVATCTCLLLHLLSLCKSSNGCVHGRMFREPSASILLAWPSALLFQVTGAVGWRKDNIKYKKNEIYLDIVEEVNLMMSSTGQVLRSDVNGKIVMKVFLSGMPDVKLGLNEKLDVRKILPPSPRNTMACFCHLFQPDLQQKT